MIAGVCIQLLFTEKQPGGICYQVNQIDSGRSLLSTHDLSSPTYWGIR